MFYVSWRGNEEKLDRMLSCMEQHKKAILDGEIPIEVDGYCTSQATAAENLAMAKIRSNRVKTEMILRGGGLTEMCFVTRNRTDKSNYVIVRLELPVGPTEAELEARRKAEAERLAAEAEAAAKAKPYTFAVRANLLRWVTLTPDVGLEWRLNRSVGLTVDGSWTSWSWDNANRRYALWEVAPEVR